MNLDLLYEILDLAVGLAKTQSSEPDNTAYIEQTLLEIINAAKNAYEQHTGETLDPMNIRYENGI